MGLLERLAGALFGGGETPADSEAERALVADTIEVLVTAVEPRLRADNSYRRKLDACTRHAIAYLRSLGRQPLDPVLLTRAAWAGDPRVNAFFATADDVPACLGRSSELRRFFDQPANAGVQEAYALLGMRKDERTVLERDVQTLVSFSGHRIVDPSATLAATRLDIGRRILLRLAQVALARIVAADAKATELHQHKAYLGARIRLLRLAKDGMEGIVKDPATIANEMKTVQRALGRPV